MEPSVLDNLLNQLNDVFCISKREVSESKGNINKFLGKIINISVRYNHKNPSKKGQVVFTMYNYISKTS